VWRGAAHFECVYRYNDTLVLDFSEDRIKKECFGGTFTEQRYSKTHEDWVDVQVPLINNAYVALCLWRLGCCLATRMCLMRVRVAGIWRCTIASKCPKVPASLTDRSAPLPSCRQRQPIAPASTLGVLPVWLSVLGRVLGLGREREWALIAATPRHPLLS